MTRGSFFVVLKRKSLTVASVQDGESKARSVSCACLPERHLKPIPSLRKRRLALPGNWPGRIDRPACTPDCTTGPSISPRQGTARGGHGTSVPPRAEMAKGDRQAEIARSRSPTMAGVDKPRSGLLMEGGCGGGPAGASSAPAPSRWTPRQAGRVPVEVAGLALGPARTWRRDALISRVASREVWSATMDLLIQRCT
jgi:hypothetical protein